MGYKKKNTRTSALMLFKLLLLHGHNISVMPIFLLENEFERKYSMSKEMENKGKPFKIEIEYIEGLDEPYKIWNSDELVTCYFSKEKVCIFTPFLIN